MEFEMEPMGSTVDDDTLRIVERILGREIKDQLLYEPPEEVTEDAGST